MNPETNDLQALIRSITKLETHMDNKFMEQDKKFDKRFSELEEEMKQLTSREAIHADAVLRNKVEIMWKVLTWGGTVVGAAILTALAALVIKTT